MVKDEHIKNGIAVFDRPIMIDNSEIYGILYDKVDEETREEYNKNMSEYIAYMVGVETFTKNGGTVSKGVWTYPDGISSLSCNYALEHLLDTLFGGVVGFHIIEPEEAISWNDGEVDTEERGPCFILKHELIDRYTNKSLTE